MTTNLTDSKLLYPELSYVIVGLCFEAHNELGRFAREYQYANSLEQKLQANEIEYVREFTIGNTGNRVDFFVERKIILELKATQNMNRSDYFQLRRYLDITHLQLGMLINFRRRFLSPQRIVRFPHP